MVLLEVEVAPNDIKTLPPVLAHNNNNNNNKPVPRTCRLQEEEGIKLSTWTLLWTDIDLPRPRDPFSEYRYRARTAIENPYDI
jgi:hypothetical protein